jgi:hypothetical protein
MFQALFGIAEQRIVSGKVDASYWTAVVSMQNQLNTGRVNVAALVRAVFCLVD